MLIPITIWRLGKTMNKGCWTNEENERFLIGVKYHGGMWKDVAEVVQTRSIHQCREHGTKYVTQYNKPTVSLNRLPTQEQIENDLRRRVAKRLLLINKACKEPL